jgi:hypothetical protein
MFNGSVLAMEPHRQSPWYPRDAHKGRTSRTRGPIHPRVEPVVLLVRDRKQKIWRMKMKLYDFKKILGLILLILFYVQPGFAQPNDEIKNLRKEVEELREGQRAIQKDLQEIKNVLRARGLLPEEPVNLFLNIADKPFKGNKNATLTLMEFSEYQ